MSRPALGNPVPLIEGNDSMVQLAGGSKCPSVQRSDGLVLIKHRSAPSTQKRLFAEAAKRYPNVPIKAVITTSDAWAHLTGPRSREGGTPIYATDLNQPCCFLRLVDAPFTQHPDTLAKASKPAKFHWVSQKTTIGAGQEPYRDLCPFEMPWCAYVDALSSRIPSPLFQRSGATARRRIIL